MFYLWIPLFLRLVRHKCTCTHTHTHRVSPSASLGILPRAEWSSGDWWVLEKELGLDFRWVIYCLCDRANNSVPVPTCKTEPRSARVMGLLCEISIVVSPPELRLGNTSFAQFSSWRFNRTWGWITSGARLLTHRPLIHKVSGINNTN